MMRFLLVVMMVIMPGVPLLAQQPVETVRVTVDRRLPQLTSRLELGFTHTHLSMDQAGASPEAVARVEPLLIAASRWQNLHIMGWGAHNPQPQPGGDYDWRSLDRRVAYMRSLGIPMVMTLCTAPGWMKQHGEDWRMESRVMPEHYEAFAALCVEVAKRYPDIRHFQVWNEFKGFWSLEQHNWDAAAYTDMYNVVYDALKAHDPTLQVGGLYLVVQGTGSDRLGYTEPMTHSPLSQKDRAVIAHWLEHKHGADFICLDRAVKTYHDKNEYTVDELMALTPVYEEVCRQVRQMTDLPIWWSELYAIGGRGGPEASAAAFASVYLHILRGDSSVALIWNPIAGETANYMFTDVREPSGGQPSPHYFAHRMVHDHFGLGTRIFPAESSSPMVEALASPEHTLIINKQAHPQPVTVDGVAIELQAYEVCLLDSAGNRLASTASDPH